MNVSEFKAWLKGFSEAMGDTPTPEQWAKIKKEIDSLVSDKAASPYPYPRNPDRVWLNPRTSMQLTDQNEWNSGQVDNLYRGAIGAATDAQKRDDVNLSAVACAVA